MAVLASQDRWGQSDVKNERPAIVDHRVPAVQPSAVYTAPHMTNNQPVLAPNPLNGHGAVTSFGIGSGQDGELLKREERRRQWVADLNDQVRQQHLQEENRVVEERRKEEKLHQQDQFRAQMTVNASPFVSSPIASATDQNRRRVTTPLAAHPSASHFLQAAPHYAPDNIAGTPNSTTATSSVDGNGGASSQCYFRKTRGFTRDMYASPEDEAIRARRAEDVLRVNMEQIEQRRRQREEEKAKIMLEEQRREERLAAEHAQSKALAEAEARERVMREEQRTMQENKLYDTLEQARQEASINKSRLQRHSVVQRDEEKQPQSSIITVAAAASTTLTSNVAPMKDRSHLLEDSKEPPSLFPMDTLTEEQHESVPHYAASSCGSTLVDAECQTTDKCKTMAPTTGSRHAAPRDQKAPANRTTNKATNGNRRTGPVQTRETTHRTSTQNGTQQKVNSWGPQRTSKAASGGTATTTAPKPTGPTARSNTSKAVKSDRSPFSPCAGDSGDADYRTTNYSRRTEGSMSHRRSDPPTARSTMNSTTGADRRVKKAVSSVVKKQYSYDEDDHVPSECQASSRIPVPISGRATNGNGMTQLLSNNNRRTRQTRNTNHHYTDDAPTALDVVRTQDILDPGDVHSAALPLSREATARHNARQNHIRNSNPGVYGDPPVQSPNWEVNGTHTNGNQRMLPNSHTVNEPSRQGQNNILQHLSEIRKGLQMRQLLYENGNYDDDDLTEPDSYGHHAGGHPGY